MRVTSDFHHVLTSSSCSNDQFYEYTDGAATGSPLSPVVANFFMEDVEEVTLSRVAFKPTC
jgi:hypothetical protein